VQGAFRSFPASWTGVLAISYPDYARSQLWDETIYFWLETRKELFSPSFAELLKQLLHAMPSFPWVVHLCLLQCFWGEWSSNLSDEEIVRWKWWDIVRVWANVCDWSGSRSAPHMAVCIAPCPWYLHFLTLLWLLFRTFNHCLKTLLCWKRDPHNRLQLCRSSQWIQSRLR
jgi:hypothetical protein